MSPQPTPPWRPPAAMNDPRDPVWTALARSSVIAGWLLIALVVTILVGGPHRAVPAFVGLGAVEIALLAGITYRMRPSRL